MSLSKAAAVALFSVFILSSQSPATTAENGHRGDHTRQLELMNEQFLKAPQDTELRWKLAQKAFELGDLDQAELSLTPLLREHAYAAEAAHLLATIQYLHGEYEAAEKTFLNLLQQDPESPKGEIGLLYVYCQTNQYEKARALFRSEAKNAALTDADRALWTLMCSFGEEAPYTAVWKSEKSVIPFTAMNFLPVVSVRVNERPVNVIIDTGGDIFLLNTKIAESLGIKPVATATGVYAGGKTAQTRLARLDSLDLGDVVLHSVPVEAADIPGWTFEDEKTGESIPVDGILSTSIFRQFLATMDYQERKLVLRPRSLAARKVFYEECAQGGRTTETPFIMDAGHFMIARGAVNGKQDMTFFLDSGLDQPDAAILLQKEALDYAGVSLKGSKTIVVGEEEQGGLGGGGFNVTPFTLDSVVLGGLRHTDVPGLYGVLPPELYHTQSGMILDGFISHQFLRHYKWTIDFDRMVMTFQEGHGSRLNDHAVSTFQITK